LDAEYSIKSAAVKRCVKIELTGDIPMASVTFDTHKFVKSLEAAGLPEAQAEAISLAVRESQDGADLATKADLREYESAIRIDLEKLEQRLDSKIEKLELRIDARFAEVSGKFALLQWMMGLLIAGVASLIIKTFF
jgi:hypothetical protein